MVSFGGDLKEECLLAGTLLVLVQYISDDWICDLLTETHKHITKPFSDFSTVCQKGFRNCPLHARARLLKIMAVEMILYVAFVLCQMVSGYPDSKVSACLPVHNLCFCLFNELTGVTLIFEMRHGNEPQCMGERTGYSLYM